MAEITFEGFAIVEMMGHRTRGGYVKDVEIFGGKMLRIDIPVAEGTTVTEFYGCRSTTVLHSLIRTSSRKRQLKQLHNREPSHGKEDRHQR